MTLTSSWLSLRNVILKMGKFNDVLEMVIKGFAAFKKEMTQRCCE